MRRLLSPASAVRVGTPDVTSELDWEHVYDVHAPRLRRLIRRKVEAAAIEDVLQETFLRAFKSRHTIDRALPMKPWLNTIALRAIADVQRGAVRTVETLDVDTECDERVFAYDALDEELLTKAKQNGIKHAFASLNSRHRRLLQLVDIEGMPYEYVARHEQMTTDAVKAALARARSNFRASYVVFTEKSGLFGAGALVGPLALKLRLRWQRYQDFVTHHAAGVGAATLTVAVLAAASVPSTTPTQTRANEHGKGYAATAFLMGSALPTMRPGVLDEPDEHRAGASREPTARATQTVPPVDEPSSGVDAQVAVERGGDGALRTGVSATTETAGYEYRTWGDVHVTCDETTLAATRCAAIAMLPTPPGVG